LPLLTAAILVLVVATSLTATYQALVAARSEAMQERLSRVARQLAANAEQSNRQRRQSIVAVAADTGIRSVLRRGRVLAVSESTPNPVVSALLRLRAPTDSAMPIELWTAHGTRLVHLGTDVAADPLLAVRPELRPSHGRPLRANEPALAGSDSIQTGALYGASGRVLFWTVIPIFDDGARVGYIASQRRVQNTAAALRTVRELLGADVTVYVRNVTDDFWASLSGEPTAPPLRRDTTTDGFKTTRAGTGRQIGAESRVAGTPWILTFEVPTSSVLLEPRATLRRLAILSLFITLAGIVLVWLISRRITRPIVELTTAAEALAGGNLRRRVAKSRRTGDEIHRLGASFNDMATEVERSQAALAAQVAEARAASEALQRASQEAEEAREAAEKANQAKSDFLAVMSHELRTPLNAIGGYAEILQMEIYGPVTEKQRDAIARIERSQQTLLSLINDVLNFAKLEAGEVQYAIGDVSLATAVSGLEPLVAPQLRDRELELVTKPCDGEVLVRADPDKLQQILLNLLSNAIKYTPVGGRITVSCTVTPGDATVTVADTGIGIASERLHAIFDPFIQVGRALNRPHEGVGLGLSISRDLAAGMGGTLTAESELGIGSSFHVTLARGGAGEAAA
jgi:signal transduction histidine kinase